MRVDNARRLTGRGFFSPSPGAVVEIWLEGEERADLDATRRRWRDEILAPLLARIGLASAPIWEHLREDGFTTAVGAPIDRCLALADALEWAGWRLAEQSEVTLDEAVELFEASLSEQQSPALLALEAAARAHEVPFLWDDDAVSLGLGVTAEVFAPRALPEADAIEWSRYGRIPVGLVTGTNGKTTTTRMVARILTVAGHTVGASSTDAIAIAGEAIETGDWTGPGAARKVLRHPKVTAAVLETARGGLIRRGLAYEQADAAVVTNIGEDHFGDFGIRSLDDMARVKATVWAGVRAGGTRIANAGCPVTMGYVARVMPEAIGGAGWVLFARDRQAPALVAHVAAGGVGWTIEAGAITRLAAGAAEPIAAVDRIPATFGGAAVHNVDNALAAAALAHALGVGAAAIRSGLESFGKQAGDNPGRLELHEAGGARVVLDFGHNPHGVQAIAPVIATLRGQVPGARLMVTTGQAGDRSDHDIFELARAVMALAPDRVAVRAMRGYERGRAEGEVEAVLERAFFGLGLAQDALMRVEGEVAALEVGVDWARPGDVILVLVHVEREAVRQWLAARSRPPAAE